MKNIDILGLNPDGGIDQQQADIGIFYGPYRSHHRIEFQVLFHLALFTQSGCIHQVKIVVKLAVSCMDGVACGTCFGSYDVPLLSDKRVDQ